MAARSKSEAGAKLVSYVHVFDDEGNAHAFGPDDDVPEWAARKMGAHVFEGGEHPHPEDDGKGAPRAAAKAAE